MTTTDVLGRMKSILKGDFTSYCDWVTRQSSQISCDPDGIKSTGPATIFVSHAWKYKFDMVCSVIQSYAEELRKHATHDRHPGSRMVRSCTTGKELPKSYFWFDIFTVNQFEAPDYPQSFWTTTFKDQVAEIGHTLLILHPWDHPIPVTRAWCVWEMYCTLDTDAEIHIRQPPNDAHAMQKALVEDTEATFQTITSFDAQESEAWKESDKNMIVSFFLFSSDARLLLPHHFRYEQSTKR